MRDTTATDEALALFETLAWRLRTAQAGARPGHQRGKMLGAGNAFADIAPLLRHPDPRRIDLRRSIADPFQSLHVRRFEMPSAITVHILLDWSASLGVSAAADRYRLASLLAAGLAQGAVRSGDTAAVTAAPGDGRALVLPPTRRRGIAGQVFEALQDFAPRGAGVRSLCAAAAEVPLRRTLTFLISDFEVTPEELDTLLTELSGRPVVLIRLADSSLERVDGRFGLCDVIDAETGTTTAVWMRPAYAHAYAAARESQIRALDTVCATHGRAVLTVTDSIDAAELVAALAGELL